MLTSTNVKCGFAPLQEFGRVVEPEGCIIVFNVVGGQEFVHLFQLNNGGLVELRGIRASVYLSGVIDIQRCPFEILGEAVRLLLEFFERLRGLDIAIFLGGSLA